MFNSKDKIKKNNINKICINYFLRMQYSEQEIFMVIYLNVMKDEKCKNIIGNGRKRNRQ